METAGSEKPTLAAPCADDPRVLYRPREDMYYMTYDNCSGLEPGFSDRVTWVASTRTPWVLESWVFHGPVSAQHPTTAGVALLLHEDVPGRPAQTPGTNARCELFDEISALL